MEPNDVVFFRITGNDIPQFPPLETSKVHIWQINIDAMPGWEEKFLTPKEIVQAGKFYFEKDKIRYCISQSYLKIILGRYANISPEQLTFARGTHGKPMFAPPFQSIQFNMTHAGNLILYAITLEEEIGVDVEKYRPIQSLSGIVEDQFNGVEQQTFYTLPSDKQEAFFFATWTLKEAYLKATGTGLKDGINRITSQVVKADDRFTTGHIGEDNVDYGHFVQYIPERNYVATIVKKRKRKDEDT